MMPKDMYQNIEKLFATTNPEELHQGLELVRKEIARIGSDEAQPLFELVTSMFYIDPLDYPELVPLLDEAISLVVGFGKRIIPALLERLDAGDIKAQMAAAHALGRIGVDAIAPLIAEYQSKTNPVHREFVLYALSKIKSPKVVQAVSLALEAAESSDLELCDTATRTLGKFVESIPPADLPEDMCQRVLDRLYSTLTAPNPGIRAKAARSLGKLAKHGHLTSQEQEQLKTVFHRLLGREHFEWDRAYIVRKQAEEALNYL
jgi:hypothetical protein